MGCFSSSFQQLYRCNSCFVYCLLYVLPMIRNLSPIPYLKRLFKYNIISTANKAWKYIHMIIGTIRIHQRPTSSPFSVKHILVSLICFKSISDHLFEMILCPLWIFPVSSHTKSISKSSSSQIGLIIVPSKNEPCGRMTGLYGASDDSGFASHSPTAP